MTSKELATVLAALRFWQQELQDIADHPDEDNWIAESLHFQEHEPLTSEEIDDLCERLNLDAPLEIGTFKHTAAPWEIGDSRWPNCIVAQRALPGALSLARVLEYRYASKEDLQFLLHAVNSHDQLRAALEIAVGIAQWAKDNGASAEFVDSFLAMTKPLTKGGES
jgi:hypothetical protein